MRLSLLLLAACADDDKGAPDPAACAQTGFSATEQRWALPDGYGADSEPPFRGTTFYGLECTDPSTPSGTLRDLTGDGQLDLVVFGTCGDEVPVTEWWVHTGGADGFAAERIAWRLPDAYTVDGHVPFPNLDGRGGVDCDGTDVGPAWFLEDLTADGVPDLVVGATCADPAVGDTVWKVHAGGPEGFAADAIDWALPAAYGDAASQPFMPYQMRGVCAEGIPASYVEDVDGDGDGELLVTDACGAPASVGLTEWRVHKREGNGFAESSRAWALPTGYAAEGEALFDRGIGAVPDCEEGETAPGFSALWVDGDGYLDLLVLASCDAPDLGDARWLLHRGGPDGFSATADDWALPAEYGPDGEPIFVTDGQSGCGAARVPGFWIADLDGVAGLDLLVHDPCDVEEPEWRMHAGGATGFGEARTWALPDLAGAGYGLLQGSGRVEPSCGSDVEPAWAYVDLDGDGLRDLVVTSTCDDPDLGSTAWAWYPGVCEG